MNFGTNIGANTQMASYDPDIHGGGVEMFGPAIRSANMVHGSPYDRGSADSYYSRPKKPHYYKRKGQGRERVEESKMSEEQIQQYFLGYDDNEKLDHKKNWY